jgi:hypothetical protein
MVVVVEAAFVEADVGLPSREFLRIQLDFVGEENVSLMRQGDDPTKASGIIVLRGASE